MRTSERGEALLDAVIATAVVAIVGAVVLSAALAAAHRFGAQPVDEALQTIVNRELRVAADILKYQGARISPATIATTAPLPGASPIPIHLSITSTWSSNGYAVTVKASADAMNRTASASATLPLPAPLPSSEITSPVTGAAPI